MAANGNDVGNNAGHKHLLPPPGLATRGLHADDPNHELEQNYSIAPTIDVSTTFRRPHPKSKAGTQLAEVGEDGMDWEDPAVHIYSRYSSETRTRCEKVLSSLIGAHALTYASGLAAAHAAIVHYAPSVIAIRKGYFGVHAGITTYQRSHQVSIIDLDDDYPTVEALQHRQGSDTPVGGLLVWVESPLNPTGEARDLAHYANKAHQAGGVMAVDSTFAPLQDVFGCGADMVMHSATKYFGGHSDLLMGILAVPSKQAWDQLFFDRSHVGNTPGNLEAWLLLRSLRTLHVRWRQQSGTALLLAQWLQSLVLQNQDTVARTPEDDKVRAGGIVERVWHASFQPRRDADNGPMPRLLEGPNFDPRHQFKAGFSATFAFRLKSKAIAEILPHETTYFSAATSLGGVESLLEHRLGADPDEDPALVRISVGLEDFADLQADLRQALARHV